MLSVDDLPCFVRVHENNVQIELVQLEAKLGSLTYGDPFFLGNIVSNTYSVLFLLLMGSYTAAIIYFFLSKNFFYVFD